MKNTKAKANNLYVENFKNALAMVKQKGVITEDMLMAPQFQNDYAMLWCATVDFINFVALKSRTSKKSREALETDDNAPQYGNANMVESLLENHVYDNIHDIQGDVLAKVMHEIVSVLKQSSVEHMYNYTFSIVNNFLNTLCKKYIPKDFTIISIHQVINSSISASDDKPTTIEDTLGSYMDNPEAILIANETAAEKVQEKKQAYRDHRNIIIPTIHTLKNKRSQLLALLYIDELKDAKPAGLTRLLLDNTQPSLNEIEHRVITDVCKKYRLNSSEVFSILDSSTKQPVPHDFRLDVSSSYETISDRIYHLKTQAKHTLKLNNIEWKKLKN